MDEPQVLGHPGEPTPPRLRASPVTEESDTSLQTAAEAHHDTVLVGIWRSHSRCFAELEQLKKEMQILRGQLSGRSLGAVVAAPHYDAHTFDTCELEKRLGAMERKLANDVEPRLIDVELDKSVDTFILTKQENQSRNVGNLQPMLAEHVHYGNNERARKVIHHPTTAASATLQADVDMRRRSMTENVDKEIRQAQTSMEGQLDAINKKHSDLERSLIQLAGEVKHLKAPQNAQQGQTQEVQSGGGGPRPNVADAVEDPRGVPDTGGVESPHVIKSWRQLQPQASAGQQYELQETVWDVLLLTGMNIMYPTDEVLALLAGMCNMLVQFLFILIVWRIAELGEDEPGHDDFVNSMLNWRVMYAHNPKYANSFTNEPLAHVVCARDSTNMEGIFQANTYMNVYNYLESSLGVSFGGLLCMLAVLLWLMTCHAEATQCVKMFAGVWCTVHRSGEQGLSGYRGLLSAKSAIIVKSAKNVIYEHSALASKTFQLQFSFVRGFVVTVFVCLPRLILLVILGMVGVKYLVATIVLEELILNAVALELILHVDEMLFEICVPPTSKMVLARTDPMPCVDLRLTSARVTPYVNIGVMVGLLIFIRIEVLGPIIQNLRAVERVMCGGDREFVAAETAIGIVFGGQPTRKIDINPDGYHYSAILQRTRLSEAEQLGSRLFYLNSDTINDHGFAIYPIPNVKSAMVNADRILEDTLHQYDDVTQHLRVACGVDVSWTIFAPPVGTNAAEAIAKFLAKEFTSLSRPNCTTLRDSDHCYTHDRKGTITRFFCPVTCGLSSPQSGNAFMAPTHGVPGSCDILLISRLGGGQPQIQCQDVPKYDKSWSIYANTVANYLHRLGAGVHPSSIQRVRTLLSEGCDAVGNPGFVLSFLRLNQTLVLSTMICSPSTLALYRFRIRSMRLLCPITCGCFGHVRKEYKRAGHHWDHAIGQKEQCPKSCFNYTLI